MKDGWFPWGVYAAALLGGLVFSAGSLPAWIALARRRGWVDDPGHRKIHAQAMPLAGGLGVGTGLLGPVIGAALAMPVVAGLGFGAIDWGWDRRVWQLTALLAGGVGMLVLGWVDDLHELGPGWKFLGQCAVAFGVAAAGTRITLFVPSVAFSFLVTVLWVLILTNALNFLDNMNGLCAGLGTIAAWQFAWTAAIPGQYLVAALGFLMCGALAGFLPYNFPSARTFLGDAGSHLVGYSLAVMAILPHFHTPEQPRTAAVLSPLLILAIPLADLVCVVWIRWRAGKPFYVGDNNHISHRLVRRGCTRTTAVLWIWLAAAAIGSLPFWLW